MTGYPRQMPARVSQAQRSPTNRLAPRGCTSRLSSQIIAIVSLVKDGGVTNAGPVIMGPFVPTQYNQDIIWADGFFIRWPGGADTGS